MVSNGGRHCQRIFYTIFCHAIREHEVGLWRQLEFTNVGSCGDSYDEAFLLHDTKLKHITE